ncbi:hypothetical protein V5799_022773 [Amblyomma americanum]|uniref:Uncharacterized protein n=1 Tax=Amblyomma americanum TaxID=6943 RepID=A0AAQ4FLT7_AMBAM
MKARDEPRDFYVPSHDGEDWGCGPPEAGFEKTMYHPSSEKIARRTEVVRGECEAPGGYIVESMNHGTSLNRALLAQVGRDECSKETIDRRISQKRGGISVAGRAQSRILEFDLIERMERRISENKEWCADVGRHEYRDPGPDIVETMPDLWLVGGVVELKPEVKCTSRIDMLRLASSTLERRCDMPSPRHSVCLAKIGYEVYLVGGQDDNSSPCDDVVLFNPLRRSVMPCEPLPSGLVGAATAVMPGDCFDWPLFRWIWVSLATARFGGGTTCSPRPLQQQPIDTSILDDQYSLVHSSSY